MANWQKVVIAKVPFKRVWLTRLRRCVDCGNLFPSHGPEERFCQKCSCRINDSRARAAFDSPQREILDFIDDTFDKDMYDRRKRDKIHDDNMRRERRGW